jgi:hypothetical protein
LRALASGSGNTGTAAEFINNSNNGNAIGVKVTSTAGSAIEAANSGGTPALVVKNNAAASGTGVWAQVTGPTNSGNSGYFSNLSSNTVANALVATAAAGNALEATSSGPTPTVDLTNSYTGSAMALQVTNTGAANTGSAALFTNSSTHSAASGIRIIATNGNGLDVQNASTSGNSTISAQQFSIAGPVISAYAPSGGGSLFRGLASLALKFEVRNSGEVRSDVGFNTPADFAEAMIANGGKQGFEPGDVVVLSQNADHSVDVSTEPNSTRVAGIFSTRPGIVASSHPMEGLLETEIPVAIMGIVPCKASAENGPIAVGDLLTTSSIPGHAMKVVNRLTSAGTIVGKAMEWLASGTGMIKVMVMLR